jgi:hypothetical protein
MKRHPAEPSQLGSPCGLSRACDHNISHFLATVGEFEPLTFPEVIEALPAELQEPGDWQIVISNHPHVVLWDELSESAAQMLVRLFECRQLALQPCSPALYKLAYRRVDLPAISTLRAFPQDECWLTCTVGLGPTTGVCSEWIVGYTTKA